MLLAAIATAEAVEANSQAVSALSDQVGFLFRAIVFIVVAVVVYQIATKGSSALWGRIVAWWTKTKQEIRDSIAGPKQDRLEPESPKPARPSRSVDTPAVDFGISPVDLIASMADNSAAVKMETEIETATGKKYQLSYFIKEIPANG